MASLNRWEGIGNCGKDPESRYLTNGDMVTNISIACTEKWKNKEGEPQEKTEWVSLVFFGKVAEIAAKYLEKGKQCFVSGRLQTDKWEDKEGITRYTTKVVVDKLVLLGSKGDGGREQPPADDAVDQQGRREPAKQPAKAASADDDEDVPF